MFLSVVKCLGPFVVALDLDPSYELQALHLSDRSILGTVLVMIHGLPGQILLFPT